MIYLDIPSHDYISNNGTGHELIHPIVEATETKIWKRFSTLSLLFHFTSSPFTPTQIWLCDDRESNNYRQLTHPEKDTIIQERQKYKSL